MASGLFYTIEFKNVEQIPVKVLIGDSSVAETANPVMVPITPAGNPVIISTIDNQEAKFTPIRAQQATISFLSNSQISLKNFADGPDDRFPVEILYNNETVFKGFLSLNDNQELFVAGRNVVQLTANDKLAALKDIPLTDFANENPEGKYKIAHLLQMCLQKTGLNLRLNVINNLRHGSGQITTLATFVSSPNQIIVAASVSNFFYIGQRVQITGSSFNNVTFTVSDVARDFVTLIASDTAFTDETEASPTFTDITQVGHFYANTYLDAKTFENKIGVSENCYSVLEKILGYDCFLTQYKGEWWICRIDEYDSFPFYVARFDENGEFEDIYVRNLSKQIGFNAIHWFSQETTIVTLTRPDKFVKLDYKFIYPLEIICNIDWSRGDFIQDLPAEKNEDGLTQEVKAYEFECWESLSRQGLGNVWDNYENPPLAGSTLYIKKWYLNDTEVNRELFIKGPPGGPGGSYVKSQPVPVHVGDKINFSVNVSYANIGGETGFVNSPVMIGLFANSGTIYWWEAGDVARPEFRGAWQPTPTNLAIPDWYQGANVSDPTTNLSFQSPPLPESGQVFVILINQYGVDLEARYSQPNFEIIPLIDGSYGIKEGETEIVTRLAPDGYLATLDDEVHIHDAPRELFKGGMYFLVDAIYFLTSKWYKANETALGFPALADVKGFGKHQIFAVWNQYRLANRIFQYQLQGFGLDIPSLVHKYSISDVSDNSSLREFMMLTAEKDLFLCEMKGTLEQVFHTQEGKTYDDTYEFKYI